MHWIWSYTVSMGFPPIASFQRLTIRIFSRKVSEQRSLSAVCSSARTCGQAEGLNQNNNLVWFMIYTLQGTNICPKNGNFEDDFPFPQVGYVNPLEGIYYIYFELQLATSRMICVPEERYDICSYQRNSILYFFHYSYVINHIHRMYTRPKINSVSRTQKVIQKKTTEKLQYKFHVEVRFMTHVTSAKPAVFVSGLTWMSWGPGEDWTPWRGKGWYVEKLPGISRKFR